MDNLQIAIENRQKEAIKERELNRKNRTLGHFHWVDCEFYLYSLNRGWIGKGKNNFMKGKYLLELIQYLEKRTNIHPKRTNRRYKKGLLKYIDDFFILFKPHLDQFEFSNQLANELLSSVEMDFFRSF
jgi:hypothetical protein